MAKSRYDTILNFSKNYLDYLKHWSYLGVTLNSDFFEALLNDLIK